MNKHFSVIVYSSLCAAAFIVLLVACGPTGQPAGQKESPQNKVAVAAPSAGVVDLYDMKLEPLTPAECGRCHTYQFKWLKDKGGKHKFDCRECHEQFHNYNPKKDNWDAIMPKCQGCHDLPHGKDFAACMDCHQQPHAPKVIEFKNLEKGVGGKKGVVACAVCHVTVGTEFAKFPNMHNTEVNCQGCHAEVHGTIPSCLDCHDPHIDGQEYNDCLTCHGPHSAKNIKQYPEDTPSVACSSCHEGPYNNLRTNVTKHSSLQCATCHTKHAMIPRCEDCHGEPHGEGLHSRFTSCLDCHANPHKLLVNKKK